jgi:transglutaminase-like putative cysteine protease
VKRFLLILIGFFMSLTTALAKEVETGASIIWTSADPVLVEVRKLIVAGELTKAEKALAGHAAEAEGRDIIRRTRREYSASEGDLLQILKPSIPDLTAQDLVKWREAGGVQFRMIDGKVGYFRREPSNIFRFNEEAKARRVNGPTKVSHFTLTDHLAQVIQAAEKSGKTEVLPIKHRIVFTVAVPPGAGGAKAGSIARIWLPCPQEYRQQKNVELIGSDPPAAKVAENGVAHRTLYYEQKIEDPSKPIVVRAIFSYVSYAYYPVLSDERARPLAASAEMGQYLSERLPHIALTPELRAKVKEIVGEESNPLARARKIFHWINGNVRYCAEEEYGVIPSISQKALTSLKGDCGVQGTLFVTMCRAAGIPARWQSGWETKPVDWNMHDWAEFYVEPWGWLPADVSYGRQKSDDPKVREFYFGHQDSYRMIVNSDYGRELVPPKQSLRSEPADFQRGEVEIDGKNLYFDEWDYDFKFEQAPG